MINKQNLWFITLFSLILILGIYYVSMPNNALAVFNENVKDNIQTIEVTENDILAALKVEEEEKILSQMEEAQKILLDGTTSNAEKNEAYEALQQLNKKKGKADEIEKVIKENFNLESCVKLDGDKINIIIISENKGADYANNIITTVQKLYDTQMYITVNFKKN